MGPKVYLSFSSKEHTKMHEIKKQIKHKNCITNTQNSSLGKWHILSRLCEIKALQGLSIIISSSFKRLIIIWMESFLHT